jgi:hypothetical protein
MKIALLLAGLLLPAALLPSQETEPGPPSAEELALQGVLGEAGIGFDRAAGVAGVRAEVLVRDQLLEYLLVLQNGAGHESLLLTEVDPALLNAALLALGLEPGRNASWRKVEPPPTDEERRAGAPVYDVTPPEGQPLFLHVGWRDGDEVFWFRLEDLVRNLATGRALARHPFVFLGSRFVELETGKEIFAAAHYGNLVNVSFFAEGYTLATAARPECLEQTIWVANGWLLPERGEPVELVFSRTPLVAPPADWLERLPDLAVERAREEPEAGDR